MNRKRIPLLTFQFFGQGQYVQSISNAVKQGWLNRILTYDFSPKDDVHNLQNIDQYNTTQSKNIIVIYVHIYSYVFLFYI